MIILDTNVLSETMRQQPEPTVLMWLDEQVVETLGTTTVTIAEIASGIDALPSGKRRNSLTDKFTVLRATLDSRILSFDVHAALMFGQIISKTKKAGYAISYADAQIASIAKTKNFAVATRDTAPFLAAGVKVVNPWAN